VLSNWLQNNPAEPGEYVLDWDPTQQRNFRGEAYKISRVDFGVSGTTVADDNVFPAGTDIIEGRPVSKAIVADRTIDLGRTGTSSITRWLSLPGSVAAYHTILGE
jgi:hypothetical protein